MRSSLGFIAVLGLLAGCGPSPSSAPENNASVIVAAPPAAISTPTPVEAVSCAAEMGAEAAQRLVDQCLAVSPASHPPCNVANTCAMIRDEIDRSCALFASSDPLPTSLCPSPANAAEAETPLSVVRDYYAAIASRDYHRAYGLWADSGRASGKSFQAFADGFAQTAKVQLETGPPSAPEGAAGSTYVTIPVTVRATTRSGEAQKFAGDYVLRRINDVPGATGDQLVWRIYSASLKAVR